MCGRFIVKMTWAEIVALYRLTMKAPPHNLPSRYNVCPTDPIDVVTVALLSAAAFNADFFAHDSRFRTFPRISWQ